MGFSHLQIASNGIRIAKSLEFAKRCQGGRSLHRLPAVRRHGGRGVPEEPAALKGLWDLKQKAVENARAADLRVVLVPTIIKTVNDDQVGNILQFAVDNSDIISGISYQPVAFTGRISTEERERQRYTLSDLAHDIEAPDRAT